MNSELTSAWLRALCLLFVCFSLLISAPSLATAQDEGEGAYKELIEQALTEFKLKNWPEARALFRRAHELNPNARTLRGLGVVSFEMRDYKQAVRQLSQALVDTRQPLTDAQRSECEGLLGRARAFVGSYDLRLTPATAKVTLDGSPVVRDQDGLLLVPLGEHTLRATAEQHQDATLRIQVMGGERGELELTLLLLEEPAKVAATAETPSAPSPLPEASPATPSAEQPVQASAPAVGGAERSFRGGGLRYTYVAAGIGLLFGGAAVASWFVGQGKFDDLSARCDKRAEAGNPCQRGDTDTDSVKTYERLTNASIGLAAVGAVATGVLFALEWPREKNVALNLGLQSVSLRGSF